MANPTVSSVATDSNQFYDTLMGEQQQAFAGNQAALQAVSSAWQPVLATGAVPYGYSAGLDSLLTSNAIQQGAAATANAENAAALQEKQAAGGANVLPTRAQDQINAQIAATGAQKTAQTLTGIKEAGYQQGVSNLEGGTQAELGIASGENETGLATGATGSGNLALSAGAEQFKENQETGPLSIAGSILGDIGTAAGDITGIGNVASMFKTPSGTVSGIPGGVIQGTPGLS
jgi:hypothetical protein